KKLSVAAFLLFTAVAARAASYQDEDETKTSTAPIGTPFYRHLAADQNIDLHELEKFEKKGFGRTEIVTLVLISKSTGKPLKDYGKQRLKEKDKPTLRDLAKEANLDYDTLHANAVSIKQSIEAKGDQNLP